MSTKEEFFRGLYRTMTDTDDEEVEDDFASFVARKVKEHAAKKAAKTKVNETAKSHDVVPSTTTEKRASDSRAWAKVQEEAREPRHMKHEPVTTTAKAAVDSDAFTLPDIIEETPPSSPRQPTVQPMDEGRELATNGDEGAKASQALEIDGVVPSIVVEETPRDPSDSWVNVVDTVKSTPLPYHLQQNYVSDLEELENLSRPRGKSVKASKKKGKEPQLPEPYRNLFRDYWPERERPSGARKIQLQRVLERGATWVKKWDDGLRTTHIVTDKKVDDYILKYEDLLKHLKINALPNGVHLVNDKYIPDCVLEGIVARPGQIIYRMEGYAEHLVLTESKARESFPSVSQGSVEASVTSTRQRKITTLVSPPSLRVQRSATSSSFTVMKKITTDFKAGAKRALEMENTSHGDELDEAIRQIKTVQDLPLDESEEDDAAGLRKNQVDESGSERYSSSDEKRPSKKQRTTAQSTKRSWQDSFSCMHKNEKGSRNDGNPNAHTIDILQKMATYYDQTGDHWRTTAYRKAIGTLRGQKEKVCSKKQARSLPNIGESIAEKIKEIVRTSTLRRLEAATSDPHDKAIKLFMGIYGVGLKQASAWVAQGHRTLDSLQAGANLTANQQVGVDHYTDFNSRIPRAEITKHVAFVDKIVKKVSPHLQAVVGGSYRRSAADSGDIDFLLTASDASISPDALKRLVFDELIPQLIKEGYLRCCLTHSSAETFSKWLGAACLPDSPTGVWRRVDILVVPAEEWGASILYFTGNDIFNRSMRLLARKKGMRLNQRGLYKDVMRGADAKKVNEGTLVEGRSEKKIFLALGVPWRPPEERWC